MKGYVALQATLMRPTFQGFLWVVDKLGKAFEIPCGYDKVRRTKN